MLDRSGPPAHVRAAEAQAQRFHAAKAHHARVELAGREALDAAILAGKALAEAKRNSAYGEWVASIETHWPGGRWTVARYIRLWQNRAKVKGAESINEALRWLSDEVDAEGEKDEGSLLPGAGDDAGAEDEEAPAAAPPGEPSQALEDAKAEQYVAQALRTLYKFRELLSEAYAGPLKGVLDEAADVRRSLLRLRPDGGIVVHGKVEGTAVGVKRLTNEAIEVLVEMVVRMKASLENTRRGKKS